MRARRCAPSSPRARPPAARSECRATTTPTRVAASSSSPTCRPRTSTAATRSSASCAPAGTCSTSSRLEIASSRPAWCAEAGPLLERPQVPPARREGRSQPSVLLEVMRPSRPGRRARQRRKFPAARLDLRRRMCRKGRHPPTPNEGCARMDRQPDHTAPTPRVWLPVGLSVLALLSGAAVVTQRLGSLQARIEEAEDARVRQSADLHSRLAEVQGEITGIRKELGTAFHELAGTADLSQRLENAEKGLGAIGAAIEAHSSSLLELEETQASFVPDIEQQLRERDERLQKRYEALSEVAESARLTAADTQARLSKLDQSLSATPDLHAMWRELVGPVVQLAGDASVGSGVLL